MNCRRFQASKVALTLVAAGLLLGACQNHYRGIGAPNFGYHSHGSQSSYKYKHGDRHKHMHKHRHKRDHHRGGKRKRHWDDKD